MHNKYEDLGRSEEHLYISALLAWHFFAKRQNFALKQKNAYRFIIELTSEERKRT